MTDGGPCLCGQSHEGHQVWRCGHGLTSLESCPECGRRVIRLTFVRQRADIIECQCGRVFIRARRTTAGPLETGLVDVTTFDTAAGGDIGPHTCPSEGPPPGQHVPVPPGWRPGDPL